MDALTSLYILVHEGALALRLQTPHQKRSCTPPSAEKFDLRMSVTVMEDALESTLYLDFNISNNNKPTTPIRRRSRRPSEPSEICGDAIVVGMYLGVGELRSHDDVLASQRTERDDRRAGPTAPPGQRLRSRASRSSGAGSSKKKVSLSGMAQSNTQRDSTQSTVVPGGDLFLRENATLARQQLTSSASRVRPMKQQQQQPPQPSVPSYMQLSSHLAAAQTTESSSVNHRHNNNEDSDEPIVEQAGGRAGRRPVPSTHYFSRGRAEWETLHGVNQAGRLPTRSRRYLNHSAGFDPVGDDPVSTDAFPPGDSDDGESPLGALHADRPPSRQCHAFPTHLLDPRDFVSPNKQLCDGASLISMTPWHADVDEREEDEGGSPRASGPEEDCGPDPKQLANDPTNQRPPSRYMVKAARGGTSSSDTSSPSPSEEAQQGRLPSRRGAAGSRNQAAVQCYHDPKTDGFLEVDESVPPPFRVEISTDSNRGQYVASQHHRVDEERRHGLKSRRSSSFGTRSQLKSLQATYGQLVPDASSVREAEGPSTRNSLLEPQWIRELDPSSVKRALEPVPAARHAGQAAATRSSRSFTHPTAFSCDDSDNYASSAHATHRWFRSINNPFFVACASPTVYDGMDAETAIANTPLFAGEDDLMAMTQLTDLHLDDFLGDPPYVYNSASVGHGLSANTPADVAKVGGANGAGPTTAAASLRTSLGRDFLSLFAQH